MDLRALEERDRAFARKAGMDDASCTRHIQARTGYARFENRDTDFQVF